MHLLQLYSLSSGSRFDKPHIFTKFFPLPSNIEKYITLHITSKDTKNYDHWQEVINLINPILKQNNILIIQIGAKNEKPINGCYYTCGQTTINQSAFLLQNTELHLGCDSFPVHISSSFGKKIVALYSNNFISNVGPCFSKPEDLILLEPKRELNEKPSFAIQGEKSINTIPPEKIAQSVLKLLNIPFNYNFETLFIGNLFNNRQIESVPDNLVDIKKLGLETLIIRMDLLHNENILFQQLNLNKCVIISDKPVSEHILKNMRPNILQFVYKITADHSVQFVKLLKQYKINYLLITEMDEKSLNGVKLDYLDLGLINKINVFRPKQILDDDLNNNKVYYKSNRWILGRGLIYQSIFDYKNNINNVPNFEPVPLLVNKNNINELWSETDYLYLLKKIDNNI